MSSKCQVFATFRVTGSLAALGVASEICLLLCEGVTTEKRGLSPVSLELSPGTHESIIEEGRVPLSVRVPLFCQEEGLPGERA